RGETEIRGEKALSPLHRAGVSAPGGAVPQHLQQQRLRWREISGRAGALLRKGAREIRRPRLVQQGGRRRGRGAWCARPQCAAQFRDLVETDLLLGRVGCRLGDLLLLRRGLLHFLLFGLDALAFSLGLSGHAATTTAATRWRCRL